MKQVVIIGAGPAGLTAAFELLKNTGYNVIVLEETDRIGGISQTVNCGGTGWILVSTGFSARTCR